MSASHSDNQCPQESDSDGRRDAQWRAIQDKINMVFAQTLNLPNRSVHIGGTVDMSAGMAGKGGLAG